MFSIFALKINRKQAYKRIEDMKNMIKTQAWNGSQIPPADGSDRKLVNEANGKEFWLNQMVLFGYWKIMNNI